MVAIITHHRGSKKLDRRIGPVNFPNIGQTAYPTYLDGTRIE
jgi:hypothetical protein